MMDIVNYIKISPKQQLDCIRVLYISSSPVGGSFGPESVGPPWPPFRSGRRNEVPPVTSRCLPNRWGRNGRRSAMAAAMSCLQLPPVAVRPILSPIYCPTPYCPIPIVPYLLFDPSCATPTLIV